MSEKQRRGSRKWPDISNVLIREFDVPERLNSILTV